MARVFEITLCVLAIGIVLLLATSCLGTVARYYLVDDVITRAIRPPRRVYDGLDDWSRRESARRRQEAAALRRASARLDSGDAVVDRLRLVK